MWPSILFALSEENPIVDFIYAEFLLLNYYFLFRNDQPSVCVANACGQMITTDGVNDFNLID
jgi:hypothetical protein